MDNAVRQLACATILQAVKDYASKPHQRGEIIEDLRSPWMEDLTDGTSMIVAEQLESNAEKIIKRIRGQEMEEKQ